MKIRALILSLLAVGTACFAMEVGRTCFSKHPSTAILAEPNRFASTVIAVEWAKPLTIVEVQGRWLGVTVDNRKGWVYAGNVTSQRPLPENKNDFLPTTAADTTAAVAARPLSASSRQYAARKSLTAAAADIEWAEQQADAVTKIRVDTFMEEKKLGDYGQ